MTTQVDKPESEEVIRRKKMREWTNVYGLLHCPKCHSTSVCHITIANEGEKLLCSSCKFEEIIAKEDRNVKRGYKL